MSVATELLVVENLRKHYVSPRQWLRPARPPVQAVDDVSFSLRRGETLALVGESGCGKTTTAKCILQLIQPTAGSIKLEGRELMSLPAEQMRQHRRDLQIIFQDPYASLNPKMRASDIVAEPLRNFSPDLSPAQRQQRIQDLFARVGLRPEYANRYAHEFSGGQRQRLGIARALAVQPKVIVCDEPVSALDVSVQAQVVNLLMDLQAEFGLAYLFVAHDLAVVRYISHRVAVMYLGQIVEIGDRDTVFASPRHPYTEILLAAAPIPNPRKRTRRVLPHGDPPSPANPPPGCRFHTRCPMAQAHCRTEVPKLKPVEVAGGVHQVACHLR